MSQPVKPGDILGGKYRVDRVLGVGGMGVVVQAHHLMLDERVAIKFLLPDAAESPDAVARFAREARAAAKIHGEHVVRVSDVGTLPDGAAYIVMEYLEGGDLKSEIDRRGPLPCEEVVEQILQALEAMAEAHALGIIHRDLKPANLFLARRRGGSICLKVVDFGISRMSDGLAIGGTGATATGSVMGTPLYMAPEQWASAKHADARSDIWSLGAILYHALTGRPPFAGESLPVLWRAIASQVPASVRSVRPDVPPALDAAVARCLEKEPGDRFQTVGELAKALTSVAPARARASIERVLALSTADAGAAGAAIPNAPPAQGGVSGPRTATAYDFGTLNQEGRTKRSAPFIAVGSLALIAVAAGGWFLSTRREPSEATTLDVAPSAGAITDSAPSFVNAVIPSATAATAASIDAIPVASASAYVPAPSPPVFSALPTRGAAPLPRSGSQPAPRPAPRAPAPSPKRPNADKFE